MAPALLYSKTRILRRDIANDFVLRGSKRAPTCEVMSMLPPYIIEEIRRREHEQRRRYEQPQVELPLPAMPPLPNQSPKRDDDDDRGVVIIDL